MPLFSLSFSSIVALFVSVYVRFRLMGILFALMVADIVYIAVNNFVEWLINSSLQFVPWSSFPSQLMWVLNAVDFFGALSLFINLVLTYKSFSTFVKVFVKML